MEEVVQTYVRDKTFMGTVLVARGTDVILSKGYGSANLEWDIPNTPATKFRLGSITKQFTAASILLLEERGKLKLDDPIKKYVPEAPAAWDAITIFNLLTHSSGIPNFTSLPDYSSLKLRDTPVAKTVMTVRDKPLDFVPGEKMSYSNSGYLVLGYVIEQVTGGSYEKFVTDNIFTPLGMKDSGYDSNTADHSPPGRGIHAVGDRAGQRGLHPHEHPACGRRALLHDRGSAPLGAGVVRRQADLGHVAREDDDAVQGRLCARGRGADRERPKGGSARRRHRRVQHVPGVLPRHQADGGRARQHQWPGSDPDRRASWPIWGTAASCGSRPSGRRSRCRWRRCRSMSAPTRSRQGSTC